MISRKAGIFYTLVVVNFVSIIPAQTPPEDQRFPLQINVVLWQSDYELQKQKHPIGMFFYSPSEWHKLGEKQYKVSNFQELLDLLTIEFGFKDLRPKIAGLYPRLGEELVNQLASLASNLQADNTQRERALQVLTTIGPNAKPAIPRIVTLMSGSLSAEAKNALAAIGHSAVPALIKSLNDTESEQTRLIATQALAQIGPAARDAYAALTEAATRDWNPEVRSAALEALVELKIHREKTDDILVKASKDSEPSVRIQALKLLKERYRTDQNIAVATNALKDPDKGVRKMAIEVFQSYGSWADSAIPTLGLMASGDTDPDVRLSALKALSEKGEKAKRVIDDVIIAVDDVEKDGEISCEAIKLLDHLDVNEPSVINTVVAALRHPNKNVRVNAAKFLAKFLDCSGVKSALEAAKADDEESVRNAITDALRENTNQKNAGQP